MQEPIFEGVDEIDSFDAYYSNVHLGGAILIVPYVNLGLSRHPLNRDFELKYLDFAYLVCQGLRYLRVQAGVLVGKEEDAGPVLHFGGFNLGTQAGYNDFEIGCESAYLQPLDKSRLSETGWFPVECPKRNLDPADAEAFFRGEWMPLAVKQLLRG